MYQVRLMPMGYTACTRNKLNLLTFELGSVGVEGLIEGCDEGWYDG
jgi:hypothetical protein